MSALRIEPGDTRADVSEADSEPTPSQFGALRYPEFRRFWLGSIAAVGAFSINLLAQGILVFDLTGSAFSLGSVGIATAVPTIIITLFGGVLADRVDRRKLLMATQVILAALLGLLATLVALDVVRVWHVIVIAVATGFVTGLDWPTRNAMFPSLLEDKSQMMSAVALSSILWQGSRVVVPFFGAILIAAFGTATVFYLAAGAFVVMFITLLGLQVRPQELRPPRNPLRDFVDGVAFIAKTRIFAVLIPLTFANMLFGLTYLQMMPAYSDIFSPDTERIGYLLSAIGIGSVSGTIFIGRFQKAVRLGWTILGGTFIFSVLIILFAVSPNYILSMGLAVSAGFFNSVFMISSMSVLQLTVPDELRGRVMGIYTITFSLIGVGAFLAGAVASFADVQLGMGTHAGVRLAIGSGGAVLALIVVLVAITQSQVRNLDSKQLVTD